MAKAQSKAAESGANSNITDIEHEPIEKNEVDQDAQIVEIAIIPLEDRKKNEVARYGVADKAISNLKRRFGKLQIKGIEDKEGFKIVKSAWQTVRNFRLDVAKKHKEIKADYLAISQAIDGEKNRLTDLLEPLEIELKTKLDAAEKLKEAEKLRKENEAAEKLNARVSQLITAGIVFDGSFYSIAEIQMDIVSIENLQDEKFADLLERVKTENEKLIQAKKEADEKAEADRLALEQQKADQEKKEKDQQAEAERLKKEREEMLQEKRVLRAEKLEGLGMVYNYNQKAWAFGNFVIKPACDIAEIDAPTWAELFAEADRTIKKIKDDKAKKEAEDREAEILQDDRFKLLSPYNSFVNLPTLDTLYQFTQERFEEILSEAKAANEADDAKKKEAEEIRQRTALRIQQLGDLFEMWSGVPTDGSGWKCNRFSKLPDVPAMIVEGKDIQTATADQWEILIASQKTELKNILESERLAQQAIDDKAEEDRKALLSDNQLLAEYVERLQSIKKPELKTQENILLLDAITDVLHDMLKATEIEGK